MFCGGIGKSTKWEEYGEMDYNGMNQIEEAEYMYHRKNGHFFKRCVGLVENLEER